MKKSNKVLFSMICLIKKVFLVCGNVKNKFIISIFIINTQTNSYISPFISTICLGNTMCWHLILWMLQTLLIIHPLWMTNMYPYATHIYLKFMYPVKNQKWCTLDQFWKVTPIKINQFKSIPFSTLEHLTIWKLQFFPILHFWPIFFSAMNRFCQIDFSM